MKDKFGCCEICRFYKLVVESVKVISKCIEKNKIITSETSDCIRLCDKFIRR